MVVYTSIDQVFEEPGLKAFEASSGIRVLPVYGIEAAKSRGLDNGIVELMRQAGCIKVYFGLESGSDAVLKLMNKKTTVKNGIDAVSLFAQEDMKTVGFFIVGYPGETMETIETTFNHALSLPLDEVFFNVPFPLPGSALFERVVGLDSQADWDKASDIRFVYTSEFDENWLRMRIEETKMVVDARQEKKRSG